MAKWGLWAAHRYVWAGASVPRAIGPDGRPLQKPWRMPSETAVAEATRIRASRAQPWWPRVVGWACIGVACFVALRPMTWVPPHARLSAATVLGPEAPRPMIAISSPHFVPEAAAFRWAEGDVRGPFTMVVLTEELLPLARFDGIEQSPWRPEGAGSELLQPGARYHSYLLGSHLGRQVKSPLITFDWK